MEQPYLKVQASELDVDLSDTVPSPSHALLGALDAQLSMNIAHPGKHHGHLIVPIEEPHQAPTQLRLPVCVIRGQYDGPSITLLSGIHGDEIEGPLTLQRLVQDIDADDVQGCLIVLPSINLAGLQAGTRCSPLDGHDLDRCFPGKPAGSLSERVAFEVFNRFIRPVDLVVDFRSGGTDLKFAPSVAVRFAEHKSQKNKAAVDSQQYKAQQQALQRQQLSEAAMIAFGAPNSVRLPASKPNSCLQGATEAAAVAYVQTELGGGGAANAETLAIARTGCYNLLRHTGLLKDEIQLRATRMLEVRDSSFYIYATQRGIVQPHAKLGHELYRGDTFLSIVDLENSGATPLEIRVPFDCVLLALRDRGHVESGDLLAIIADEVHG